MKPRIFIGSSTGGLNYARAIQVHLNSDAECVVWDQGLFLPSLSTLGNLDSFRAEFDFAIMIFSSDDHINKGGTGTNMSWRARDNVVFETGLMMASLGRERVIVLTVKDRERTIQLLSDLDGINYVSIEASTDPSHAVAAACFRIRENLQRLGSLWPARDIVSIDEGHRMLYDMLADPRVRTMHHSALSNKVYTQTPATQIFNDEVIKFATARPGDRSVFYLFYPVKTMPARLRRAHALLDAAYKSSPSDGGAEPRREHVNNIRVSCIVEPHHDPAFGPNFIVVGSEHVFVFLQPDLDANRMILLRGRSTAEVFKNLFRALWTLGTEITGTNRSDMEREST
jgi:hypothetical protein